MLPITRTGQRVVGRVRDRIGARGIVIEVGQDGGKGHHLHRVGIALRTQLVDGFGDGGEGLWEEELLVGGRGEAGLAVGGIDGDALVFADEDGDVGVVGPLIPVVPLVEVFHEVGGLVVVVEVIHGA